MNARYILFLISIAISAGFLPDVAHIKNFELGFVDLTGQLRSVVLPQHALEAVLHNGLKFDGSSIAGCSDITASDMHLTPDLKTCRVVPAQLTKNSRAFIICDSAISETEPNLADARIFLKQAISVLEQQNLTMYVGIELEFYLFDRDHQPVDTQDYFAITYDTRLNNFIDDAYEAFEQASIEAIKFHHEVSNGQFEFVFKHADALAAADQLVMAKHILKGTAAQHGYTVSFMPKPIFGINGSGMHMHYSVFNQQGNVFADATKDYNLSTFAQSFIAGNLQYAYDVAILYNYTVNSYKRLVPGYEAPNLICCGAKNRSALIRIPLVNKEEVDAVRAEIRCPDPLCNPYLAIGALILTGLQGVKQQLPLTIYNQNLFKLSSEQIAQLGVRYLPASLQEALNAFQQSSFVQVAFSQQLLRQITLIKSKEVKKFELQTTNLELKNYSF